MPAFHSPVAINPEHGAFSTVRFWVVWVKGDDWSIRREYSQVQGYLGCQNIGGANSDNNRGWWSHLKPELVLAMGRSPRTQSRFLRFG